MVELTPIHAWGASDVGRKRRVNEDSFLLDSELGLSIVADGMGGHAAGELASARCVEVVRQQIREHRSLLSAFSENPTLEGREAVQLVMVRAIQQACAEIYALGQAQESARGMGTTCVALLVLGDKAVIGHVGDSRVYLLRCGRVHQLTEDHSLVEEHVKRGIMTRAQAEASSIRNVITRAVGLQPSVDVDVLLTEVAPGDLFVLCSDGLHGYLSTEELPQLFSGEPRAALPSELVKLANERGGKDNITAVVVYAGDVDDDVGLQAESDIDAKAEVLRRIPLFQYMNYKELLALLGIARGRQYRAGDLIFREDEPGEELFVIFRGRVEVSKNEQSITQLGAGGHFGEMGLIDSAPRSATVTALEATNVIAIPRDTLLKLMRKDSRLAVKLLWAFSQAMAERLRETSERVIGLQGEVERLLSEQLEIEVITPPPPPFDDET